MLAELVQPRHIKESHRRRRRGASRVWLAGEYNDAETGLNSNGYRTRSPYTWRFGQSDPEGLAGGISTYAAVGNNPLSYSDPFGLNYAQSWAAGFAVAGGVIGAGLSVGGDFVTGGVNLLATGPEIAGGVAAGGGVGYALGSALDWATGGASGAYAQAPDNAYDPNGPKAPGKPGPAEGFVDPKGGESWVPNPFPGRGGASHGWEDSKGKVWCPTGQGGRAHGGPHWDVQDPKTGGNTNVPPGTNINDL